MPTLTCTVFLNCSAGVKILGETVVTLQSDSLKDPSIATFSGLSIETGKQVQYVVQ